MISPSTPYARTENLRFKIHGVPNGGPELCLALDMRGDPVAGHPREMARFAQIGASGTTEEDVTKSVQSMTWVNDQTFNSGFYYRNVRSAELNLSVVVDGGEKVMLESLVHVETMHSVGNLDLTL